MVVLAWTGVVCHDFVRGGERAVGRYGVVPRRLFSDHVCKGSFPVARPAPDKLFHDSILFCPRCNGVRRCGLSLLCTCPVRDGWGGVVPVLDDGACTGGDLVRGGGARAGASGVEASRACGLGHHQCGVGHPSRPPLFRMVSSRAGAGSAPGAVGGEWRHTNERW